MDSNYQRNESARTPSAADQQRRYYSPLAGGRTSSLAELQAQQQVANREALKYGYQVTSVNTDTKTRVERVQKFNWETRTVVIPKTIYDQQVVYETKLVPVQVPRTIEETFVVEVPYRAISVPVRQLMERRTKIVEMPRQIVENYTYEVEEDVYEERIVPEHVPPQPAPAVRHAAGHATGSKRVGLGMGLELDEEHGWVVIRELLPGFAAQRCGQLREGDLLVSVDGQSVAGHALREIKELTVANEGSVSRVVVRRNGRDLAADLTRVLPPRTASAVPARTV